MGFWNYAYKRTKRRIWVGVSLAIILVILNLSVNWVDSLWGKTEPFVTLLTLGVALLVWREQIHEEWEEDYLPKRLTTSFFYNGKEVMRCEKAQLAGEADIRALGQQIGSQMTTEGRLEFVAPAIEMTGPQVLRKERYVHYIVKFTLTRLPKDWNEGYCRLCREPFVKNRQLFYEDIEPPSS